MKRLSVYAAPNKGWIPFYNFTSSPISSLNVSLALSLKSQRAMVEMSHKSTFFKRQKVIISYFSFYSNRCNMLFPGALKCHIKVLGHSFFNDHQISIFILNVMHWNETFWRVAWLWNIFNTVLQQLASSWWTTFTRESEWALLFPYAAWNFVHI